MIFFCQDVLRLNTLYTVPKNFLLITKWGEAGKALSFSPLVRACNLEIFPIGTKKSAPRTLVCYTAVFSVIVLLPGALRDDTKKGCVADYSYSGYIAVNDLINARGVYLILKVQVEAFTT